MTQNKETDWAEKEAEVVMGTINRVCVTCDAPKCQGEAKESVKQAILQSYRKGRESMRVEASEVAENYQSKNYMFLSDGKLTCGDSSHDDRWCSHCSSKEDGADQVARAIRSIPIEGEKK